MITAATFESFIFNNNLCHKQHKILLAVSGGADSMAMCALFMQGGYQIGIAHCNFNLRNIESDNDAAFVSAFAANNQLPYFEATFDTLAHSKNEKISVEEAARNLRYHYFAEICTTHGYQKIATAHHQNDNAETILLRLVKGTGLLGLKGIPIINGDIIRPLLFTNKNEIEIFCKSNQLTFCTDFSNTDIKYQRNKIRHNVIPILEEINPAFISTMHVNIDHFKGAYQFYKSAVDKRLHRITQKKGENKYIPIAALGDEQTANILLYELLHPLHFNSTQINQIINCFGTSGSVFYSNDFRVLVDRKYVIICSKSDEKETLQIIDKTITKIAVGDFHIELTEGNYNAEMSFNETGNTAYFDASLIEFPLQIRKWKAGDYLYPLGLKKRNSTKTGKKKVSDILTNAKVDTLSKENTYVLLSGEKIIWLVGIRQDERFKVNDKTKLLLKIKMLL